MASAPDDVPFISAAPWPVGEAPGLWFAFRGRDLLVDADGGLPRGSAPPIPPVRVQRLGALRGEPCYAAELPAGVEPPTGSQFRGLRELFAVLPPDVMAVAGRAVQIMDWDRTHQFCGVCGTATVPDPGNRARRCPTCALTAYPRLSPAVIVAVERGPELLLARSVRFPQGTYSVVAGFVDPGESAEEAVHREVFEETGVRVHNVRYFGSQPWPFPHSLMLGFQADYAGGEVTPDRQEIEEAAFYRAGALPPMFPGRISISKWLIHDFCDRHGVPRP
jgi:NAD+ diphosphatase